MSTSNLCGQIPAFLAKCTLVASCFILWSCSQVPRYPAVVYTVPACYDNPPVQKEYCKDWSSEVYLNLDFLAKSDSVLWMDITDLRKNAKSWRLNIFNASTDGWVTGTYDYKKSDWSPMSDPTIRLKPPLEVLLRAEFEFCYSDDCNDSLAKTASRTIPFLMHTLPD